MSSYPLLPNFPLCKPSLHLTSPNLCPSLSRFSRARFHLSLFFIFIQTTPGFFLFCLLPSYLYPLLRSFSRNLNLARAVLCVPSWYVTSACLSMTRESEFHSPPPPNLISWQKEAASIPVTRRVQRCIRAICLPCPLSASIEFIASFQINFLNRLESCVWRGSYSHRELIHARLALLLLPTLSIFY